MSRARRVNAEHRIEMARKPTSTPVDVARTFNAPVLTEYHVDEESLLHEVGGKRMHRDLSFSAPVKCAALAFASSAAREGSIRPSGATIILHEI